MSNVVATNNVEVPSAVREPKHSRPSLPGPHGWMPGHDDHGADAVAWRAAHAIHEVAEVRQDVATARQEVVTLRTSVDTLNTTLNKLDGNVRSFLKWALGIATVLFTSALLGLGAMAIHWFATLHH